MPLVEQMVMKWFPHGYCLSWDYRLIFTSVVADWAIFISYFTIAGVILYARKNNQIKHCLTYDNCTLWACFILSCGITHLWSGFLIWHAIYVIDILFKLATALISALTAVVTFIDIRARVRRAARGLK